MCYYPFTKRKVIQWNVDLTGGINLLEHAMKVVERILEHRIRQQIEVDDMQFGFMKSKGTTDAIFTVRLRRRILELKERRSTLGSWIWKKLFIGFREK